MQHRSQTGPVCLSDGAKSRRDPRVDLASWHIPLNEAHGRLTITQDNKKRLDGAKKLIQRAHLSNKEGSERVFGQIQSSNVQL